MTNHYRRNSLFSWHHFFISLCGIRHRFKKWTSRDEGKAYKKCRVSGRRLCKINEGETTREGGLEKERRIIFEQIASQKI